MSRGGARKGSGRPKTGSRTVHKGYSLPLSTVKALEVIPCMKRSQFVSEAIIAALARR